MKGRCWKDNILFFLLYHICTSNTVGSKSYMINEITSWCHSVTFFFKPQMWLDTDNERLRVNSRPLSIISFCRQPPKLKSRFVAAWRSFLRFSQTEIGGLRSQPVERERTLSGERSTLGAQPPEKHKIRNNQLLQIGIQSCTINLLRWHIVQLHHCTKSCDMQFH